MDSGLTRFISRGIRFARTKASTNFVGINTNAEPTASYTITLPANPPASIQVLTMSPTGVLDFTTLDAGLNKGAARVASTANVTISAPGASIDGVTLAAGNLVLLKDQTAGAENGLYVWNGAAVPMTRATNSDTTAEVSPGMYVFVSEGTVNADRGYQLTTNDPITLGTTALTFTQTTGNTGGTLSIANGGTGATTAAGARTNLGVPGVFRTSFTNATLSSNILTVTHNLNAQYGQVEVIDEANRAIRTVDDITYTGANALTVDLTSFGTLTGTWQVVVVA